MGNTNNDLNKETHTLKSLPFFAKEETQAKHKSGKKFSRAQLVEIDRVALVKTFEQCITDVKQMFRMKEKT